MRLGDRLLAVVHHEFMNLVTTMIAEFGVRNDLALLGAVAAGHSLFLDRPYFGRLAPYFERRWLAVLHALRVEHAAQDVIAHARQVLHAAAADHAPPSAPAGYGLRRGCSRSTSKPLVSRTLATLRSAEFGFFGVVV